MPHLSLPLSMEVICHHIDEVQVLGNLRNILPCCNGLKASWNCSCEQEARLS
ncbi:hypothetical protein L798_09683 [Zootermopsis nevadensis]|uniref:Uncharacterized protein n=1 Tax=Zootermopsis nevadensis TaxID=136037 RepID=A0A067R9H5_ZOONE|nr:hypothetical protein L798_09683 [Zootermopsis nevadensis]